MEHLAARDTKCKTKTEDVADLLAAEMVKTTLFDEGERVTRGKLKAMEAWLNETDSSEPDLMTNNCSVVTKAPVTESTGNIKRRYETEALNFLHDQTIASLALHERPPPGPVTYDVDLLRGGTALTTTEHIKFDPVNRIDKNYRVNKDFVDELNKKFGNYVQ